MKYYYSKKISKSFDEAEEAAIAAMKEIGFGILTEINVKETFKKKLDKDFKNYKILGACNPNFAFEALNLEDKIGSLLPCNVCIIELDKNNTEVALMNPATAMSIVDNKEIKPLAEQVEKILKEALENI